MTIRVLTFLHSFEPGGVERVALRLCRAWSDAGLDSALVLGRPDGALRSEAEGLEYQLLSRGRIPTAPFETLWMIAQLPGHIRRTKPDVLFSAGNTYSIVAVAMKILLGSACPPIVAKVSNDLSRADLPQPVRWFYHRWLRMQARFIDRFVGMAPPMREEIAQAMGVDPERVGIVDDPALTFADIERHSIRAAESPRRNRFVAAGRLAPQKNFALLLRAFARIAHGDDRLTILGEGPERASLEREAAELGIAPRVRLPGHVLDLAPWFANSDVFALSSDYEGVPAVIAEALAAGHAIAATDCSVSMRDMLRNGDFGQITPPGDEVALATALEASRTTLLDRAAMRGQAMRFTVENSASHYAKIFVDMAAAT